MTFSSLCEFLSAGPARQIAILREQKYPKINPIRRYAMALEQVVALAVSKRPLNPQARNLSDDEREVVGQLVSVGWQCPTPIARKPKSDRTPMTINGVEISVFPDLVLSDPTRPHSGSGVLKFHFAKTRALAPEAGRRMAALLYQRLLMVDGVEAARPELCMVYDIRRDQYYKAGRSHKQLYRNIEAACQIIFATWDTVLPHS